jgi:hypothetical protein
MAFFNASSAGKMLPLRIEYSRFLYLPEQAPGEHTAVIKIKSLPKGTSYYAGQLLIVGKVLP